MTILDTFAVQLAYLCHSRWQCRCNYHHPAYPDGLKAKTSCPISEPTVTLRQQSTRPDARRGRSARGRLGGPAAAVSLSALRFEMVVNLKTAKGARPCPRTPIDSAARRRRS